MRRTRTTIALAMATSALSGCATPFAGNLSEMDWRARPAGGTVAISDPKLYRREALINERRDDVAWLDAQLEASKTAEFKPEVARELEQISSFAAALGLNFDPASGLSYRRSKETGDIQQQIDVMKLQLQLDQLKRDAELVRSQFASQTTPVNTDISKLSGGTSASTPATSPAAAADQLKSAIASIQTTLANDFGTDAKLPGLSNSTSNPIDVFRDRSALRDTLKSAKNAASLDELSELGGASLIRLTFQSTVIPEPSRAKEAGVIQMTVAPPQLTDADEERLYRDWLDYINRRINVDEDGKPLVPDNRLLNSAAADNFDILAYRYAEKAPSLIPATGPAVPLNAANVPAKTRAKTTTRRRAKPAPGKAPLAGPPPTVPLNCYGPEIENSKESDAGCATLVFAVPKFQGTSGQEGAFQTLQEYLQWFDLGNSDLEDSKEFQDAFHLVPLFAKEVAPGCKPLPALTDGAPLAIQKLNYSLRKAELRVSGGDILVSALRIAEQILKRRGIAPPTDVASAIAVRTARARLLVETFERAAYGSCTPDQLEAFRKAEPALYLPPAFLNIVERDTDRVAIYEVGPREQVQTVSTTARDANSLSLALSLAASAPGSGLSGNAAAQYARQAMGKAATLERLPGVVGYSVQAKRTFGWVIGPRATLDPKGKLELAQTIRTNDLSVDLSVPAWWPQLDIVTITSWSPDARDVSGGRLMEGRGTSTQHITVPMSLNNADYLALTNRLALGGLDERREPTFSEGLAKQVVSACRPTTIYVKGTDIWRSTVAIIGGVKLGGSAIAIAPDMQGVLIDVPALDGSIVGTAGPTVQLTLLTPYGPVTGDVQYVAKPAGGCGATDAKPSDAPTIASITPTQFQVSATDQPFSVAGDKLDQITKVTLNGGAPATLKPDKSGKSLIATFSAAQTAGLPVSASIPLDLYAGDTKVAEKNVEVTANPGAK